MPTLAEVLERNEAADIAPMAMDALRQTPVLSLFDWDRIDKLEYKSLKQSANPVVAFGDPGAGSVNGEETLELVDTKLKIVEQNFWSPKAIADQTEGGAEVALAITAQSFVNSWMQHLEKCLFYGTAADPKGYNGFTQGLLLDLDATGTGSAGDKLYEVFLVRIDPQAAQMKLKDGVITFDDLGEKLMDGAGGRKFRAYSRGMMFAAGLQMNSGFSVVRIKNITAAKPLTKDLLRQAYAAFPQGKKPTHICCNEIVHDNYVSKLEELAINGQASEADVQGFKGMPFVITDTPLYSVV